MKVKESINSHGIKLINIKIYGEIDNFNNVKEQLYNYENNWKWRTIVEWIFKKIYKRGE